MLRITAIIILFLSFAANAQSVLPPVGSSWSYQWTDHNGGYHGPNTLYYTGDTIASGITYKKIASAWNYTIIGPYPPNVGSSCCDYLLEKNDSVFNGEVLVGGTNKLLYAFNQNIGDSILFNPGTSIQYKIVFDSLRTQSVCGSSRRVLYYTKYENGCTDSVRIIEGIGPVNDYLFLQGIANCELGPGSYAFTCADITTCVYPGGSCSKVPLKINTYSSELRYSVHAGEQKITIAFGQPVSGELIVTDLCGKIISSEPLNNSLEKSTAVPTGGLYFVRITSDKGNAVTKVVCAN